MIGSEKQFSSPQLFAQFPAQCLYDDLRVEEVLTVDGDPRGLARLGTARVIKIVDVLDAGEAEERFDLRQSKKRGIECFHAFP